MTFFTTARDRWRAIARMEQILTRMEGHLIIMARTEAELAVDLDAIATGVTTANTNIADLKAQIAALIAGQPVSQQQLDDLTTKADSIAAALKPVPPAAV